MEKRYQVFVSSTFADLQDERQEVIQALLELDCIPAGMELFPAANADQWTLIKRVIDECDYYMVIVAGRYGTMGSGGISYTEMEYRYALEHNKPIIGFLHEDPSAIPAGRCDTDPQKVAGLNAFRDLVKQKPCRFWDSPADLGSKVSRSLMKLIKSDPAVGWIRADQAPEEDTLKELLGLRKQVEELQRQLAESRTEAPKGTQDLSQGDEDFPVSYRFKSTSLTDYRDSLAYTGTWPLSWNQIFSSVGPAMLHEATDDGLRRATKEFVETEARKVLERKKEFKTRALSDFEIEKTCFYTIVLQFRALGLIRKSDRARSVKDTASYWTLTPYGDDVLTRIRAIQKPVIPVPLQETKAGTDEPIDRVDPASPTPLLPDSR